MARHGDATNILFAESVDGDTGDERGVDASAETDESFGESAFADVIASAEDEGFIDASVYSVVFGADVSGAGLSVDEDQVFLKCVGSGEKLSVGADREARAVEDQRVVSADLVDHDDGHMVALGDGREHLEADLALVTPVGRGGDVEDERAGSFPGFTHKFVDGIDGIEALRPEGLVVPGVFANGEGDAFAIKAEGLLAFGWREIALFVEDVVEGQEHLRLGELDLALAHEGGGVFHSLAASLFCWRDEAGDDGDGQRGGCIGDFLHGLAGALDEGAFFKQVGGGVAADGKFREDDEIGSGSGRLVGEIHDFGGVAAEIPDGGVDLCQRDLHSSSLAMSG